MWPSKLETACSQNETEHGARVSEPRHKTKTQDMSAGIRTPLSNTKQGTQMREHTALCNFSAYLHYESGIFNVNVYIDMKTEFKIIVYFINFLTPGKRVYMYGSRSLLTESNILLSCFFTFFRITILSYQNACYGCENIENRTWSKFSFDGQKFQSQCPNVTDTTWGRIYFLTCYNFGLSVQRPPDFACRCADFRSWRAECDASHAFYCFPWLLFQSPVTEALGNDIEGNSNNAV